MSGSQTGRCRGIRRRLSLPQVIWREWRAATHWAETVSLLWKAPASPFSCVFANTVYSPANPIITFLLSFFVFLPFSVRARVHSDCGLHSSLALKGFKPAPLHLNGWEQAVPGGFLWVTQLAMERSDPTLLHIQPSFWRPASQPVSFMKTHTASSLLPCKTCGHFSTSHGTSKRPLPLTGRVLSHGH